MMVRPTRLATGVSLSRNLQSVMSAPSMAFSTNTGSVKKVSAVAVASGLSTRLGGWVTLSS